MILPVFIRDHQGRWLRLFPLSFTWIDRLRRSELPPDIAGRVRRRIGDASTIDQCAGLILNAVVTLVLYGSLGAALILGQSPRATRTIIIVALVFAAMHVISLNVLRWQRRRTIISAMLAERRCPSCAYDLTNSEADERGLTTCPECGAAWIVPEESIFQDVLAARGPAPRLLEEVEESPGGAA